jgi:hypothetical protein
LNTQQEATVGMIADSLLHKSLWQHEVVIPFLSVPGVHVAVQLWLTVDDPKEFF